MTVMFSSIPTIKFWLIYSFDANYFNHNYWLEIYAALRIMSKNVNAYVATVEKAQQGKSL